MTGVAPGVRLIDVESESPWSLADRITSFDLSLQANAIDRLVLKAHNQDLALFGHVALQRGTALDVRWGYENDLAGPRRFYFEDFKGCEDLSLEFSGAERTINREAHTKAWSDKHVAEVIREVAESNGFQGDWLHIDDLNDSLQDITQAAETDAALLARLARAHGYAFFVGKDGLHWEKPRTGDAPLKVIRYALPNATALSCSVTSNQIAQPGRVEFRTRDPIERKTVVVQANGKTPRETLAESVEVIDPQHYATARQKQNASSTVSPTAAIPSRAAGEAAARFSETESHALEIRLPVVGDQHIEGGQVLTLETPSPYLNGNYFVQEARHTIGEGGYVTSLHLTRDGGGRREGTSHAPQGGEGNNQQPKEAVEFIDLQRSKP